jgi:hypothetical protein
MAWLDEGDAIERKFSFKDEPFSLARRESTADYRMGADGVGNSEGKTKAYPHWRLLRIAQRFSAGKSQP